MSGDNETREQLIRELGELCRRVLALDEGAAGATEVSAIGPFAPATMQVLVWSADDTLRVTCHSDWPDLGPRAVGRAEEGGRTLSLPALFRAAFGRDVPSPQLEHVQRALTGEVVEYGYQTEGRFIENVLSPWRDGDGRVIGVVGLAMDVTGRRQWEEQVHHAAQMEALARLAGGVAHDFNNLLTVILGNLALANLYVQDESDLRDLLAGAESAALRARELTRRLLAFSRGAASNRRVTSIADLAREATACVLEGSGTAYRFAFPEGLWPAEVDQEQMAMAIRLLVTNADQSMPQGGLVEIEAENVALEPSGAGPLPAGRYVRVTIRDHGAGIPRAHLARVFEPYFTTRHRQGGLDLAVAYSIVRGHGGHIVVESEPGRGSSFSVYLPAGRLSAPRPDPEIPAAPGELPPLAGGRILIVDDEDLVRQTAGEMLKRLGCEVEFAGDGEEAIQRYQAMRAQGTPYDAIIMDLVIPGGIGGQEALARLRQIDPRVKSIASSGSATDPIMTNYSAYGFRAALPKPYMVADVRRALYKVIFEIDV